MKFKKRYLVFAWLAIEIASIPAAAQIIDKVAFSVPQKATHIRLAAEPGLAKFVVASNAPFAVIAENTIGEFNVSVHESGLINGRRFGTNAQMPGEAATCAALISPAGTVIYAAKRKTAAEKGDILSQAVIIEIRYAPEAKPDFKVLTQKNAKSIQPAQACEPSLS
jgi:hypothetical protein